MTFNYNLILILLAGILSNSCKKNKEKDCSTCPVGGVVVPSPGCTFTKTGNIRFTADSSYYLSASNTLVAFYQGNSHKLTVKNTTAAIGTYTFNGTTIKVTYFESVGSYLGSSGTLNISSNTNTYISGDFISTGIGGGIIGLNGQFTSIKKR